MKIQTHEGDSKFASIERSQPSQLEIFWFQNMRRTRVPTRCIESLPFDLQSKILLTIKMSNNVNAKKNQETAFIFQNDVPCAESTAQEWDGLTEKAGLRQRRFKKSEGP